MTPADLTTGYDENEGPAGPDFEPIVPSQKKKSGMLWLAFVATAVVIGGAAAWHYWGDALLMDPDADIPLIRAEEGPIKVQPESPGGMDIPDRDKLVYDRIEGNGERPAVERLLPPPEIPMSRPAPQPGVQSETQPETETAAPDQIAETPPPPPAAPEAAAPKAVPPASEGAESALQPETPTVAEVLTAMRPPPALEPEKMDLPAPPVAETPAPAAAAANGSLFKIQLAAVRSEDGVMKEWDRLRRRHSDLLGSLEPSVMRADLGPGKGVFFRLRAGPLADEGKAKDLCAKLTERKVGCLIVRPEG